MSDVIIMGEPAFGGEFQLEPGKTPADGDVPILTYNLTPKTSVISGSFSKSTDKGTISYHVFHRSKDKPTEWKIDTGLTTLQWSDFPADAQPTDQEIYLAIVRGYELDRVRDEEYPNQPLDVVEAFYIVAATTSKRQPGVAGLLHWSTANLQFHLSAFGNRPELNGSTLYYIQVKAVNPMPDLVRKVLDGNGTPITVTTGMNDTPPASESNNGGFLGVYMFCKPV